MTEKTRLLYEQLGPAACLPLFAQSDRTHTSAEGAVVVAGLVVEGILEHAFPLGERLLGDAAGNDGGAGGTGPAGGAGIGAQSGAGG